MLIVNSNFSSEGVFKDGHLREYILYFSSFCYSQFVTRGRYSLWHEIRSKVVCDFTDHQADLKLVWQNRFCATRECHRSDVFGAQFSLENEF